jgi:hypothetical protein
VPDASFVSHWVYNEVCALPEAQGVIYGNPYHRALESVMPETTKTINRHAGKHMVAFSTTVVPTLMSYAPFTTISNQ